MLVKVVESFGADRLCSPYQFSKVSVFSAAAIVEASKLLSLGYAQVAAGQNFGVLSALLLPRSNVPPVLPLLPRFYPVPPGPFALSHTCAHD